MVVGSDGPRDLTAGALNTFPADVAVQPGDVIGINSAMPASTACNFFTATENPLIRAGNLAVGESGAFGNESEKDVNVSAVVSASNTFTLGKAKLKKKNGTATLAARVPNPGEVDLSGMGIKTASSVSATGNIKLLVQATGRKRKKLTKNGAVKVKPTITYTPAAGEASTQTVKLKLRLVS
jgi:hypothetical protein